MTASPGQAKVVPWRRPGLRIVRLARARAALNPVTPTRVRPLAGTARPIRTEAP